MKNEINIDNEKFQRAPRKSNEVRRVGASELDSFPKKLGINFFLSLFIFLIAMMSVLFTRMELKRKSYEIYKLSSEYKIHDDEFRTLYTDYSKKVSDREISGLALNRYSIKGYQVGKVINIGSTSFMVKQ